MPDMSSARPRVRGLQSIMHKGSEEHIAMQTALNKLNQLRWEKDRLIRERRKCEDRIRVIDETLRGIHRSEASLRQKLAEALPECGTSPKPPRGRADNHAPRSVVIRY